MDTLKKEQQEAQERLTQLYQEREEVGGRGGNLS